MKNKELFDRSVAVLTKAYINDTLKHGHCQACAVGNLVCAARYNGDKQEYDDAEIVSAFSGELGSWGWSSVFSAQPNDTDLNGMLKWEKSVDLGEYAGRAKREIDSTGYTVDELVEIEYAFESCSEEGDKMLNGLYAVYDVLCEIHEVQADEVPEAQLVFVK